ncbi:hypothetical protein BDV26DRAFT_286513 [Aspergillus bertholletiae]|uniref:Zn(2)-C6 fungal-type domain-containing protein n=1 Tax=Aspergillus bertholletiae TaxID=1226010 RepID=A0A5N7AR21_9EURO|nr:hypothetical protein BDV26DRAFT_286513 [Aspergillus bertholletiae]
MNRRQASRRHACFRCMELKVKCSIQGNGKECQRCSRLGRPCVFPSGPSNNPGRKSRIDELQDQINELRNQLMQRGTCRHSIVSGDEAAPQALHQRNSPVEHTRSISPCPGFGEHGDLLTFGILTFAQCIRLLDKFRTVKMPHFPFVIIPDSMNAITLRQNYPFLFVVIMAVSTEDKLALQKDLDREVKRTVSLRIIMNNERNIDLPLGLLVYTAWYHYHWESMYLVLQLTVTMVADLGLDRQPNFTMQTIAANAYVLEMKVKPVLVLGQIVYHTNGTFLHDELSQLDNLISSTEHFIVSFIKASPEIATHLPLSFYTYLWYALLVLSKLLLLSELEWEATAGLGRRIHGIALATIEKHAELSRSNDVWANSKRVIRRLRGPEQRQRNHPTSTMHHSTVVGEISHYSSASVSPVSNEPRPFAFPTQQLDTDQVATEFRFDQIASGGINDGCDEVRPACSGCLRHSVECDYQLEESSSNISIAAENANARPAPRKLIKHRQTFISSYQSNFKPPKRAHRTRKSLSTQLLQCSAPGPILPALSCRPFEFTILDMELFHNFVSPTDYGDSAPQGTMRVHQTLLPRLGFSFPYVLRLLLACSGFQLARRPEIIQLQQSATQRKDYYVAAERHYNIAIREVADAVPRLNKENCHAVYNAAVYIFLCSLAMGPRPGEYMAFRDDGQEGFLSLFMGVRTVLDTSSKLFSSDQVLNGDEGESISESEPDAETTSPTRNATIASDYGYWMGQIRHLIESELGSHDTRHPLHVAHYNCTFMAIHLRLALQTAGRVHVWAAAATPDSIGDILLFCPLVG